MQKQKGNWKFGHSLVKAIRALGFSRFPDLEKMSKTQLFCFALAGCVAVFAAAYPLTCWVAGLRMDKLWPYYTAGHLCSSLFIAYTVTSNFHKRH